MISCERWPWLSARTRSTPELAAVILEGRSLSYGELAARVRLASAGLGARGVGRGDVVAALLPNGLALVELFHATCALGAILLPLNLRLSSPELSFQLQDSGARWLVHGTGELAGRAAQAVADTSAVRTIEVSEQPEADWGGASGATGVGDGRGEGRGADGSSQGPIALLYTSGTTGRPKGALLSAANFHASASGSARLLGAESGDRWLVCLPLYHVGGLSILVRSVLVGSSIVLQPRFDPEQVNCALDRDGVTRVSLVATMFRRVLDARGERPAPESLQCVLLGGGPTPRPLLERALAQGFSVVPTYGLTEACSQVATRLLGDTAPPLDGRLQALPGTQLRIVDPLGAELPAGTPGEICVRGPTVMDRYLGRPEATRRTLRDGWLHTGDVGCCDAQGALQVFDRRGDLILSGGENVYPAEVEAVLEEHPAVREAAVVGVEDAEYGERPFAWLVVADGGPPAQAELSEFCRRRLAAFKVPVGYRTLSELPRSSTGKLLRRALRAERPAIRPKP